MFTYENSQNHEESWQKANLYGPNYGMPKVIDTLKNGSIYLRDHTISKVTVKKGTLDLKF